jgi:hypothetical protein
MSAYDEKQELHTGRDAVAMADCPCPFGTSEAAGQSWALTVRPHRLQNKAEWRNYSD